MADLTGLLINSFVGIAGYCGGRFLEKRDNKSRAVNEKIKLLTDDINKLSDSTIKFFVSDKDERTTTSETALIGSALKRLSNGLKDICQISDTELSNFHVEYYVFRKAITAEPYGEENFKPLSSNDERISNIQDSEESILNKLKKLEKH